LPQFYGEFGVWISFPLADIISTIITGYFLRKEVKTTLMVDEKSNQDIKVT